ncbi:MAG: hypothetical protein GEV13_12340 [Rhodospirillales bacterium]|nr:hypothetical protein [Rhodospirillales bacterium]
MRSPVRPIICAVALACVGACVPDAGQHAAHHPVSLVPPYSELPPAPAGMSIEAGTKVTLDARQQEAVVAGVSKWMKTPASTQFGIMSGARNSRGVITVCGEVNGRNGSGAYVGMRPYVGVLLGPPAKPDFVVVGIAASERERAEVASLCRDSGVTPTS